jgi:hypothetical protein
MLVYVKKSEYSNAVGTFSNTNIPATLKEKFDAERALEDAKLKEIAEAHLYLSLQVVTDKEINTHTSFSSKLDLVDFDTIQPTKILKNATFADLKVNS